MHKMLVLYGPPKDPAHFKAYYTGTHLPLAARLPGLKASRHAFDVAAMGGASPCFCVFEAEFSDAAAMGAAMASDAGKAVAADVKNYATGTVTILHYPVA